MGSSILDTHDVVVVDLDSSILPYTHNVIVVDRDPSMYYHTVFA